MQGSVHYAPAARQQPFVHTTQTSSHLRKLCVCSNLLLHIWVASIGARPWVVKWTLAPHRSSSRACRSRSRTQQPMKKTPPNQEALDAMIREAFLIAPRRRHLLQTYALEPAEGLRRQLVQETNRLGLRANLGKDFGRFSHSNHAPTKGANGKKRMLCITFI